MLALDRRSAGVVLTRSTVGDILRDTGEGTMFYLMGEFGTKGER